MIEELEERSKMAGLETNTVETKDKLQSKINK